MTTQTEITKSNQAVQAPLQIKTFILSLVFAVLLILSLIGAANMVLQPRGRNLLAAVVLSRLSLLVTRGWQIHSLQAIR